jgi:predicted Rossmann fold nucleotide-binding protein DprA/Smf involved in DNA uptake
MSDSKSEKPKLKDLLKRLREERGERFQQARAENKETRQVRATIVKVLGAEPRTVPELADELGLPTEQVLWHVMAMRKYGRVLEDEQEGDFFRYRLVPEEKGK